VTDDVAGLVTFIHQTFGATGAVEADRPSVVWIGDSPLMVSATGVRDAMPAFLYVYVADCDDVYARAVAAGATTVEEPVDTPYGDRRAMVEDRWLNVWQIATQ
jgi:PhnB protein